MHVYLFIRGLMHQSRPSFPLLLAQAFLWHPGPGLPFVQKVNRKDIGKVVQLSGLISKLCFYYYRYYRLGA